MRKLQAAKLIPNHPGALKEFDNLEPDAVLLRELNGPDLYPRPDSVPDLLIVVMLLDAGVDVNAAWGDDIEIAETPHLVGAKWPLPK